MLTRLSALCLVLLMVACTQAPQPLRHSRTGFDPTALRLRDGGTVYIQPIEGIAKPLADIIEDSLAESLAARGIPATANPIQNPPYSARAQAVIERDKTSAQIKGTFYWTFRVQSDGSLREFSQPINVARHRWSYGDQAMVDTFAEAVADEFAGYLQDQREREAVEQSPQDKPIVFYLDRISGAPGDGTQALRKAMGLTLRQLGARISNAPVKGGYILSAEVEALEPYQGKQRIKIVWRVQDAQGQELGQSRLNNRLDADRLTRPWGRLAYEISRASAQSIGLMVQRHQSEQQFERSRGLTGSTAAPGRRNRGFNFLRP